MQLIQKLQDDQKCMKKVEPSSRSKSIQDIGSFMEALVLNQMPTKIELTLEQSQQGVSNDVLVSIEGVEELKRNVWIKGENKAALPTLKAETGSIHMLSVFTKVEGFKPPQEEVILIRRSERTHLAPNRLCLNVEVEEHSLGDLNEPASYKAAMLDSESNKWIDAINAEIQSMIDNMAWLLVDLPPGCKTVGSNWIFKKNTGMDGIIHTYKAHLVEKGYTQLYEVDYKEMFSPVTDIRAIRILISIAAYYDYEICQHAYMDKILKRYKMDNSKRGHIPMQEKLDLNKTQGASTPKKVKRMENVPYSSVVGFIMYAVRCTRPGVTFMQNITSRFQQNPVEYKSSKQSTTAMSATKAEYIATSEATMEAVWIRKFISGLGIVPTINEPIRMFCDNSAALHFANELGVQRGAKHYHRRYHYVRESITLGEIRFFKVHTDDNLADPFIKELSNGKLTQHARSM
uniref:Reverse transcriptase Ty1/copia-type domain-containing protein n=1 Tax=Tanacetum cinerariifolium TaxID=118510 RepID=A0A6L2NCD1_TANCI|nr:hypothetical protein [Tanacetum cinerariifolium]